MGCRFGKRKKKNLSHQIQMLMSSPHCFKLMIGPCLFFCCFFFFPFGVGEFRLVVPLDVLKRGGGGVCIKLDLNVIVMRKKNTCTHAAVSASGSLMHHSLCVCFHLRLK